MERLKSQPPPYWVLEERKRRHRRWMQGTLRVALALIVVGLALAAAAAFARGHV